MWKFHLENAAILVASLVTLVAIGYGLEALDNWLACKLWGCW
jgi:hypothetical protein